MKKTLTEARVCACGAPLHWTFLYDGAEYFCMNCQGSFGMLGAGKVVKRSPQVIARQKVANDVFKALRKHMLGSGHFTKRNCKKCKGGSGYHTQHLTALEGARDQIALKILDGLKGKIV